MVTLSICIYIHFISLRSISSSSSRTIISNAMKVDWAAVSLWRTIKYKKICTFSATARRSSRDRATEETNEHVSQLHFQNCGHAASMFDARCSMFLEQPFRLIRARARPNGFRIVPVVRVVRRRIAEIRQEKRWNRIWMLKRRVNLMQTPFDPTVDQRPINQNSWNFFCVQLHFFPCFVSIISVRHEASEWRNRMSNSKTQKNDDNNNKSATTLSAQQRS